MACPALRRSTAPRIRSAAPIGNVGRDAAGVEPIIAPIG
ncbi:hypothetical protein [Azospirillum palustre]